MRRLLVLLALAAGIAGGWVLWEREAEDEEVAAATWNTCVNPVAGFAISYPAAWHTDHPAPEFACMYFDPRPFELPRLADWDSRALQVVVGGERGSTGRFQQAVAGGLVRYGHTLRRGGRSFTVFTTFNRGADYSTWKRIVDRAATSLVAGERRTGSIEGADVAPPQAGLPDPVARKRQQIWKAAARTDYAAVARLADPEGFEYTFGGPVPGGPGEYWRTIDRTTRERPLPTLAAILELPYSYDPQSKLYVWPFAFTRKASTLTPEERAQLADAIGEEAVTAYDQLDSYLGWRAGVDADGDWVFYVAGD